MNDFFSLMKHELILSVILVVALFLKLGRETSGNSALLRLINGLLLLNVIAGFLANGRYELHLRHLRRSLHTQCLKYIQAISEFFPSDTKVTRPAGGFALWLELDRKTDSYKLHKRALKHGIGIAPGQIFSSQGKFENYFRISFGLPWSDKVEKGLKTLGELVAKG